MRKNITVKGGDSTKRFLAEAYTISHLCPLCQFTGSEQEVEDHMVKDHTDEEIVEITGWDMADFEEDN